MGGGAGTVVGATVVGGAVVGGGTVVVGATVAAGAVFGAGLHFRPGTDFASLRQAAEPLTAVVFGAGLHFRPGTDFASLRQAAEPWALCFVAFGFVVVVVDAQAGDASIMPSVRARLPTAKRAMLDRLSRTVFPPALFVTQEYTVS